MWKEIFRNMVRKKQAVPLSGFAGLPPAEGEPGERPCPQWDAIFGRSLRIRQVDAGSCNACEWECTALTNPVYDIQRFGIDFVASPRHADILLVTGPVSRQMELALKKTYLATPEPRIVVACGDCARDGGIYRGSYAVTNGVAQVVPVDHVIPGCPPSPGEILKGLIEFMGNVTRSPR